MDPVRVMVPDDGERNPKPFIEGVRKPEVPSLSLCPFPSVNRPFAFGADATRRMKRVIPLLGVFFGEVRPGEDGASVAGVSGAACLECFSVLEDDFRLAGARSWPAEELGVGNKSAADTFRICSENC